MTSVPVRRTRPIALLVAMIIAATALVGLGSGAASAVSTTFTTHTPSVSGTTRVGRTLGVSMSSWSPKPTIMTYQWLKNGLAIPGALGSTYIPNATDVGAPVSVEVTGVRLGYTTTTRTSAAKTITTGSFAMIGTPKIGGSAKVDKMLTASPGSWKPAPGSVAYQWNADGAAIAGETGTTYTVAPNDTGKKISLTVTATLAGYLTIAKTSSKSSAVSATAVVSRSGTYSVGGTGLQPGTYITSGSPSDCYWATLSSLSGKFKDIIAYNFGSGPEIVTILGSDAGFTTSSCGDWIRLSDAPTAPKTAVKTGVFAVGQQLESGTYQSSKTKGCYWATLSGFDSYLTDVIDSDFGADTKVTIGSADAGFLSSGCGTWTRTGN